MNQERRNIEPPWQSLTRTVKQPAEGIEPTTAALQKRCSTVELRWQFVTIIAQ